MIILDTNVVSELMRDSPQQTVLIWIGDQPVSSLFVTTVTEAEILTGIALLPYGRRRRDLSDAADRVFATLFVGRILGFDSDAANIYAEIFAQRHAAGSP